MKRVRALLAVVLLAIVGMASVSSINGQILEPVIDAPENLRQRIQETYALTRSAKTAADFSRVVEECRTLLASQLEDSDAKYLRSLTAWALTRRAFERIETAEAFLKAGNQDQFDQVLESAWGDLEESVEFAPSRAKTWLGRAIVRMMRENYVDALNDLTVAMQHDPKDDRIRFYLAEVQLYLGKASDAVANYDAVLEKNADDVTARTGRGHALSAIGQLEKAIHDFRSVTQTRENDPIAWLNLGNACLLAKDWNGARDAFERSLQCRETPAARRGLATVLLDASEESVRDGDRGLALARTLVATDGRTLDNLELLAHALELTGHDQQRMAVQKELEQIRQSTTTADRRASEQDKLP